MTPGERKLSDQRVHQLMVLMRADAEAQGLINLFARVHELDVVRALKTKCKEAERSLTSGTFSEEKLWRAIPPVVDSLTAALDASNSTAPNTRLRDVICDGDSDEEELQEHYTAMIEMQYAASAEACAEQILGCIKHVKAVSRLALAQAANAPGP